MNGLAENLGLLHVDSFRGIHTISRVIWKFIPAAVLAAAAALPAGCSSTSEPASGDLRLDLRHKDPRIRMDAAYRAASEARLDLLDLLVLNLSDRDESVRFFTGIALKKLADRDFGYRSHGSLLSREEAIGRWRRWIESRGASASAREALR